MICSATRYSLPLSDTAFLNSWKHLCSGYIVSFGLGSTFQPKLCTSRTKLGFEMHLAHWEWSLSPFPLSCYTGRRPLPRRIILSMSKTLKLYSIYASLDCANQYRFGRGEHLIALLEKLRIDRPSAPAFFLFVLAFPTSSAVFFTSWSNAISQHAFNWASSLEINLMQNLFAIPSFEKQSAIVPTCVLVHILKSINTQSWVSCYSSEL